MNCLARRTVPVVGAVLGVDSGERQLESPGLTIYTRQRSVCAPPFLAGKRPAPPESFWTDALYIHASCRLVDGGPSAWWADGALFPGVRPKQARSAYSVQATDLTPNWRPWVHETPHAEALGTPTDN